MRRPSIHHDTSGRKKRWTLQMHLVAEDTAEALANCHEARKELVAYTQVEVPAVNAWSTLKIFLVYHMRPALALFPCCTACLSGEAQAPCLLVTGDL